MIHIKFYNSPTEAGIVIPLKQYSAQEILDLEATLGRPVVFKMQPNVLIINEVLGNTKHKFKIPDGLGGLVEVVTNCKRANMTLEYRSINSNNDLESPVLKDVIEYIPFQFLPLLANYKQLFDNEDTVNLLIGQLTFQDSILSDFKPKLDMDMLGKMITDVYKRDLYNEFINLGNNNRSALTLFLSARGHSSDYIDEYIVRPLMEEMPTLTATQTPTNTPTATPTLSLSSTPPPTPTQTSTQTQTPTPSNTPT